MVHNNKIVIFNIWYDYVGTFLNSIFLVRKKKKAVEDLDASASVSDIVTD
jgi:hypothetical protein